MLGWPILPLASLLAQRSHGLARRTQRTAQETQGLYWFGPPLWCYTLLQFVVWWIASWADDGEQYKVEQPREGLFLAGVMNCSEEFSHLSLSLISI